MRLSSQLVNIPTPVSVTPYVLMRNKALGSRVGLETDLTPNAALITHEVTINGLPHPLGHPMILFAPHPQEPDRYTPATRWADDTLHPTPRDGFVKTYLPRAT
jgi:hypothetical protein